MFGEPFTNELALITGGLIGVEARCITLTLQGSYMIEEFQFLSNIFDIGVDANSRC